MTEKQCMAKIKKMMKGKDGGLAYLFDRCERLLKSGGVDLKEFDRNQFTLPKIILTVALEDVAFQYSPLDKTNKAIVKNLKHF